MADITADVKVLVAMRDDKPCRQALDWAIKEFSKGENSSVCLLLTHIVTDLRNLGEKMRVPLNKTLSAQTPTFLFVKGHSC